MPTQGIAPGLACHLSAWGDRNYDSGRRDSRVVVRARIVSLLVVVRDLGGSWVRIMEW